MGKGKKGQTKQGEPTAIPLSFDKAVEGLLGVRPGKKGGNMVTADELRKKITRKDELIARYAEHEQTFGDDSVGRASAKYYRNRARRFAEEKTDLEDQLAQLTAEEKPDEQEG